MEAVFNRLIQLQDLDKKIKEISLFLDNIPSRLHAIDAKIKESEQIVDSAKSELTHNQKIRRNLEADTQDVKERQKKYKSQLNSVKTNLEYSTLLKEIDDVQKKIDTVEEQIITEMLSADDLEEAIQTAERKAEVIRDEVSREKDAIIRDKEARETKKAALLEKRNTLVPQIPADLMTQYSALSGKLFGIALSPIMDEFCAMCYMRIRPQMLNEIRAEKEVILCENCGRILYFERTAAK